MQNTIQSYVPGVLVSVLIAFVAHVLSNYIPYASSVLLALLIGAIAGNTFMNGKLCAPGLKFAEKNILEMAIVLIGFGLETEHLQTMGGSIIWLVGIMVVTTLILSWMLGKVFKSSSGLAFLLGAGSAICGSSAIAATAPIVEASEEETGLSLGLINVLGVLGLIGLPVLAQAFSFTEMQAATLLGGVLQSLGHVVASGYAMDGGIGEWATVVKMGRILFMVPLLIVLYIIKRRQGKSSNAKFPYFILLFVLTILLAQTHWISQPNLDILSNTGGLLLMVAMAAIGAKIRLSSLVKISRQGVVHGTVLFIAQIMIATVMVYLFIG